jgi:predicted nucleic acid-binding protein
VFNEKEFLSTLQKQDSSEVQLFINSIIYLELGYIYFIRQKWALFTKILNDLKIKTESISKVIAERAIKAAVYFKDTDQGASYYFRDCLIGATAELLDCMLITKNLDDFGWLQKEKCLTPEQLLKRLD